MKGIFIAYGKDVNKTIKNIDANIMDICPTVLSYFDQPIPKDIDGRVLKDLFTNTKIYIREII